MIAFSRFWAFLSELSLGLIAWMKAMVHVWSAGCSFFHCCCFSQTQDREPLVWGAGESREAWYLIPDVDRHAEINWIWSLKNQNPGIWSFSLIAEYWNIDRYILIATEEEVAKVFSPNININKTMVHKLILLDFINGY